MIIDQKKDPEDSSLPNYDTAVRAQVRQPSRTQTIAYAFTPWTGASMLLVPHSTIATQDVRPLYRVAVELDLNPLLPVSYTTRVTRCGHNEGDLVGEFSLSLNSTRAVLRMGDHSTRLSRVLFSVNSSPRHFNWILSHRLHWDCRKSLDDGSPMCICYIAAQSSDSRSQSLPPQPHASASSTHAPLPNGLTYPQSLNAAPHHLRHAHSRQHMNGHQLPSPATSTTSLTPAIKASVQVAVFVPPPPEASPPLPDATLTIYPSNLGEKDRQKLMDEIVVSALVIERMLNR
ncbi:hypothetical protein CPB83DRAFT_863200 [Crepidotus variabilis]|uniref:Uncharacterized protein n=1 Tax=Crepidotus variabilis TaxID=179855 RepID=A0A9P6E639_9AGAR|nr:hypothetical protein CPB83DRAFT_863200 [Crepidotus variabilis]